MGLLRTDADFRRLWLGHTISQFGTQIGMLAIPLTAAITLDAGTFEVAALTALQYLAFLLVGLPAGAWVDRMRRRPVLVVTDLARAGLIASVPPAQPRATASVSSVPGSR